MHTYDYDYRDVQPCGKQQDKSRRMASHPDIYLATDLQERSRRTKEDQAVQVRKSRVNLGVSYVTTDASWPSQSLQPQPAASRWSLPFEAGLVSLVMNLGCWYSMLKRKRRERRIYRGKVAIYVD